MQILVKLVHCATKARLLRNLDASLFLEVDTFMIRATDLLLLIKALDGVEVEGALRLEVVKVDILG